MADRDDRLLRIEQKVDKLADAIISIARAEEKLIHLQPPRYLYLIIIR